MTGPILYVAAGNSPRRAVGRVTAPEGNAARLPRGRSWEEAKEKGQGLCGAC